MTAKKILLPTHNLSKSEEKAVSIQDMMHCREQRAKFQNSFLESYHSPVISFCMNIPGPIKTNSYIRQAFEQGYHAIKMTLLKHHIFIQNEILIHNFTGDEYILSVDANASEIKKWMCDIEDTHPLGRIFDIDVIDTDGTKLSRDSFRKCILCDCQAQECARSRRHSVDEMFQAITELIRKNQASYIL